MIERSVIRAKAVNEKRCPYCGSRTVRAGFVQRTGFRVQRFQCVNKRCGAYSYEGNCAVCGKKGALKMILVCEDRCEPLLLKLSSSEVPQGLSNTKLSPAYPAHSVCRQIQPAEPGRLAIPTVRIPPLGVCRFASSIYFGVFVLNA
jgi:hypothetical protein